MADTAKQILDARELIGEVHSRLHRIIEMARLVRVEADHLPPDSEPNRLRVLAEVAQEAAEFADEEMERLDLAFKIIGSDLSVEAAHA